jgi:Leucine-rich repeat (LRR) protein
LISLSLINCEIEDISEKEFDHWPHLRMVSLARNSIKALKSCWFSVKLLELWSLDLSYNKISTIDTEFFLRMPALRRLRLDNNELKNLNWNNWNAFGYIPGSLKEFTFESKFS